MALGHDELWVAQAKPDNPKAKWCDATGTPHVRIHAVAIDPAYELVFDASITGLQLPSPGEVGEGEKLLAPAGVSRAAYLGGLVVPGIADQLYQWHILPDLELDHTG